MPHIIVEYTDNLSVDMPKLLDGLHESLAGQESINIQAVKTRAVPVHYPIVGDAHQHDKLIHIVLKLLEGRAEDLRVKMAIALHETARKEARDNEIDISVDVVEMTAATYVK